uniref:Putative secreted protein n=1 Tax=Ixodes ricinus TaxID=34613 RepID=A0A6B0TTQ8_IXORI
MMAESAEMGLRMGLVGLAMSTMTTCAASPTFSRTQMNLSDSIVSVLKPTLAALMPMLVSCKCSWNRIGNICVIVA